MKRFTFVTAFLVGCVMISTDFLRGEMICGDWGESGVRECQVGIESSLEDLAPTQEQSAWCWAACISMVFGYYGHPVMQETIVTAAWGAPVNLPALPLQVVASLNRVWIDENGNTFQVRGDALTANAITAAQDLAADHPLIVGSMNHAMVLTGERYLVNQFGESHFLSATVYDPGPGRGERNLTPQEWSNIQFAIRIRVF
jgi:Papain-like cysteine protease AvrRpt2